MKFKLMAVEVGERKSKGKQVSCIDTASQHALIAASAQAS